jgi:flagellar FliJ protein
MKFTFPLQVLLNWKRNLEEFAQMKLAEKIQRLRKQEEEIARLAFLRFSRDEELREKSLRGIQAGEYILYKDYEEESRKELLSKEDEKKNTIRVVAEERGKLVTLTKERKILDRLKEKRFRTFLHQMEIKDQKEIDEMTVMKSRRVNKN